VAAVEALRTGSLIIGHAPAGSSTPEGREEGLRMCVSARVCVCVWGGGCRNTNGSVRESRVSRVSKVS
jgi:hypothetical protein